MYSVVSADLITVNWFTHLG